MIGDNFLQIEEGRSRDHARGDLTMLLKAVNAGWVVADDTKRECVKRLEKLMHHEDGRIQTKAIGLLIKLGEMELSNIQLLLRLKAEEDRPNISIDLNTLKPEQRKVLEGIVDGSFPKELGENCK